MSTLKVNTIESHSGGPITINSSFNFSEDVSIDADLDVTGNITIGGNIVLGNEPDGIMGNDTVTFSANINSDLLPESATLNLGIDGQRWHDLWLNDNANIAGTADVGILTAGSAAIAGALSAGATTVLDFAALSAVISSTLSADSAAIAAGLTADSAAIAAGLTADTAAITNALTAGSATVNSNLFVSTTASIGSSLTDHPPCLVARCFL